MLIKLDSYRIRRIVCNISENQFLKGFLIISSGAALAQAIGIASTPIITRLYTPSDFGVLIIFSSVLSFIIVLASLRYELAIPLPEDDLVAGNLGVLSILLVLLTTAIASVLLARYGGLILITIKASALGPYIWLLILGFFGSGMYQVLEYWAIRRGDYGRIARTSLSRSLGGSSVKVFLGFLSLGPMGLLVGEVVAQASGCGTLALSAWLKDQDIYRKASVMGILSAAREYLRFPFYSCPASFLNVTAIQLPALALAYEYGTSVVGLFGLAYSLLVLPTSLVSASLSQAYFCEAARLIRNRSSELEDLYLSTTRKLAIFAIPSIGLIGISAPLLFPIIFGDKWSEAGIYCLPLVLVAIPQTIVSPVSNISAFGFNRWQLAWDATRTLLIVICFVVSYKLSISPVWTLTAYGLIMLLMYYIYFLLNLTAIRKYDKSL